LVVLPRVTTLGEPVHQQVFHGVFGGGDVELGLGWQPVLDHEAGGIAVTHSGGDEKRLFPLGQLHAARQIDSMDLY
jgi:hypothetical protein